MRARLVLVALSLSAMAGCALGLVPLSADPIDSRVVDSDTGAPIEGAVVLAYWELHSGSLSGDSRPCGAANVEDTVTDKDGRFQLPGWGPTMPDCSGQMRQGNPHLYVFKPGYYFVNMPNGEPDTKSVMTTHNAWQDHPVFLRKIEYAIPAAHGTNDWRNINSLEVSITPFIQYMPTQCNWKKAPNMLRALALQRQAFIQAGRRLPGLVDMLMLNDEWYQKNAPQCGSPKAFIEGLVK
ncbi:MAG TPA: carboxypeptidase-like regulatory domain-containing protein [Gammaproteobacteria bacterium]|jgi:hypothetical protein|nr:carboxypeptidase-like regulatory domain-containing protein [Gammaproteobacteria bacterium]